MAFIRVFVNSIELFVDKDLSILETCRYAGLHVPRFCYHELLSSAGNCRMCLVEIENAIKPVAACVTPIMEDQQIFLDTPLVLKARENILETILLNHPLDCPICDQAGECDLQDQAKSFGTELSRFFMPKRSVEDKQISPLISTIMTRCIHCTRCIRFSSEILGSESLGLLNRGTLTEIGTYSSKSLISELSGNIVDLCPVGALTSKSYSFKSRPWELKSVESIDLTDSLGSHIIINFKELSVFRIIPKLNNVINGVLISDPARYFFDSLNSQRLFSVYAKKSIQSNTCMVPVEKMLFQNLNLFTNSLILIDDTLDLESINGLKFISYLQSGSVKVRSLTFNSFNFFQSRFKQSNLRLLQSKIIFFFSCNLKLESAILNNKVRMKFVNDDVSIYKLGGNSVSNFESTCINLSLKFLVSFLEGKHKSLVLLKSQIFDKPLFFFGESLFNRGVNKANLENFISKIIPSSFCLSIAKSCNSVGLEFSGISCLTQKDLNDAQTIVAINLKETLQSFKLLKKSCKSILWCNTHGPQQLATVATGLIPLLPYMYDNLIYINLENRAQIANKVFMAPKMSKSRYAYSLPFELKKKLGLELYSFKFLNIYKQMILDDDLFNISSRFIFEGTNEIQKISLLPLKFYIEDIFTFSKLTHYSKNLSNYSLKVRSDLWNF